MPDKHVYVHKATYGDAASVNAAVEVLLSCLPAVQALRSGSRVLLKPNLLGKFAPQKAVTTHPDVVRAVISFLQKRGISNIILADSPGGLYTPGVMQGVYKTSGLQQVCGEAGVPCYTECESVPLKVPQGQLVREFAVIKPVTECDLIINLPKMKTHVMTVMSGAVKNLFGCVAGLKKAELHMQFPQKKHFGQMLVDLNQALAPTVHLVDGIMAMEGDGPSGGEPKRMDMLVAGEDPYALDLYLCRVMGLQPAQVPFLAAAQKSGLCGDVFDAALLKKLGPAAVEEAAFVPPRSYSGRLNFGSNLPRVLRGVMPAVESWAAPRPVIHKKECIGCGKCAEICPQSVITLENKKAQIAYKNCIRCFCCHEMCPVKAIGVRRRKIFGL